MALHTGKQKEKKFQEPEESIPENLDKMRYKKKKGKASRADAYII